ncbi:MAG: undecaprenyl-phosphate glucose phosphotransferase [Gammaproteobacteria bacterium]|nr:undecaprenyl-phosphate glucose phosphotransferase [Gammaproteobacteria bacterium]
MTQTKHNGLLRPHQSKISVLYRLADVVLVVGCLYLAVRLHHQDWHDRYSFVALLAAVLLLVLGGRFELYRSWRIARLRDEIIQLWFAWLGTVLGVLVTIFALKTTAEYSRLVMGSWFVITPLVLSVWRFGYRNILYAARRRGHNTRAVAIAGANQLGVHLVENIHSAPWMGLRLAGVYDDRVPEGDRTADKLGDELSGNLEQLVADAEAGKVDIIYITFPLRAETRVSELIMRLSNSTASVYFVPDFHGFEILHGRWTTLGEVPVISIFENPYRGIEGWIKRAEDIVVSILVLILMAIPTLVIAIGVKLSSPGPVVYIQRRYGIDGQEIRVYKFRSMRSDNNPDETIQATRDDPRVTGIGRFLRRNSLDELPQLYNVLKGEMSIVGPRPHAVAHNEQYRKLIKQYMLRHKVKPGMTGWAQVNGWRGETDTLEKMEQRVLFDLEYIRNWSLGLDLKILVLTLLRGIVHKNAY